MKKSLLIFVSVLVLAIIGAPTADAKKKNTRSRKANTTAVTSSAKIAKDVNEYCEAIEGAIRDEILITSSAAMRFLESPLSQRVYKYQKQGKLTSEQLRRIKDVEQRWDSYNPY